MGIAVGGSSESRMVKITAKKHRDKKETPAVRIVILLHRGSERGICRAATTTELLLPRSASSSGSVSCLGGIWIAAGARSELASTARIEPALDQRITLGWATVASSRSMSGASPGWVVDGGSSVTASWRGSV